MLGASQAAGLRAGPPQPCFSGTEGLYGAAKIGAAMAMSSRPLPPFAHLKRDLPAGLHPYLRIFPGAWESPALARIEPDAAKRRKLLDEALVSIKPGPGFAYVDVEMPCIVLAEEYYRTGSDMDLYMDMLHELAHIRQHRDGLDLWDERFAYVDRPTEIEGYAVAVEEGRRLGLTDEEVIAHLSNPWMDEEDVTRLLGHTQKWIARREGVPPVE